MPIKREFLLFLLVLALASAACNLPGRSQSAQDTPVPPVVEAPPITEPAPPAAETEDCVSPLEPGLWAGNVQTSSTASRMGFQVIEQQAALPLNLNVGCDGSINGTAARSGQAGINVPLAVNGTCTDQVEYDVTGMATGTPQNPVLNLSLAVRDGSMNCNVNSRISSVPSGEQQVNVAGQEENVQVNAASASSTRVDGVDWPDRFYQEQLPDIDRLIVEYELEVQNTSTWYLERQ